PTLAAGLLVQQRLAGSAGARQGLLAATGTGVALLGMLALLAGLGCAWPRPELLVLDGLLDFAVLSAVAFALRMPPAHRVAPACLAVSYTAGYHWLAGWPAELARDEQSAWLVRQVISGQGGAALAGLVTLLAVVADRLRPTRRRPDADYYAVGAGLLGLLSVA